MESARFVSLIVWFVITGQICSNDSSKKSIAIVGGGIGGTASSHFLWELLSDDIKVDLYEEKEIGGRMATIKFNGREYESGGSIIHPANLYMKNFTSILGLARHISDGGRLAIFNGNEMVFDGSRFNLVMILQLFYHYGWDIYRIDKYVKNLLTKFDRVYEHQEKCQAFTTVENLLGSMDASFVDMIHRTIADDMSEWGFGEAFINELVLGGLRTNYGQGLNIQSFVGGVSMAGIEPGLWSVHGGNKLIPINLLNKSPTTTFKAKVSEITLIAQDEIKYKVQSVDNKGVTHTSEYDFVIVAAPMFNNIGDIKFNGFPEPVVRTGYNFHRTLATFVEGIPNLGTFKIYEAKNFPSDLLTCNNNLFYNSIGKHSPVDSKGTEKGGSNETFGIYKVFSNAPLTDTELNHLFEKRNKVKVVDWLAYPEYPSNSAHLPSFQMHQQMFHVNAIEMAASAMEMSAIAAKNVALLISNKIKDTMENIDNPNIVNIKLQGKQEL